MQVTFRYGREAVELAVPDSAEVFESSFPEPAASAAAMVLEAVRRPVAGPSLGQALAARRAGDVVVVVSDITRPIPYATFLPELLAEIEGAGVPRAQILVLVATGMHRPCTAAEHREMLGDRVTDHYRIVDHRADADAELVELPGRSWSGNAVKLNRRFIQAGFRMITGLVEPHFMAGFSGGRKSVCPGLAALETIRNFHGEKFLGNPLARNANLAGNPLHEEALSVARLAGVDFGLDVVLSNSRSVVRAFAGPFEASHREACAVAGDCTCRRPKRPADVAITSCGGHPLDATFYQCVKGMIGCLPAVRVGGEALVFGGCSEGIGGAEYADVMKTYSGRWREFLEEIKRPGVFIKDQWELQMQCRALAKVGEDGLHFISDGLSSDELRLLSVHPHAVGAGEVQRTAQRLVDDRVAEGKTLAVFPEGPYCVAVSGPCSGLGGR